jgi:hypothetical protein
MKTRGAVGVKRNLPQFDNMYLWMDDLFGYGRRMKMEDVWK